MQQQQQRRRLHMAVAVAVALVAGVALAAGAGRAAAATPPAPIDLGTLGGPWSQAVAISGTGQVVGISTDWWGYLEAFSWTKSGGMAQIGTLGGVQSLATAVSPTTGQVVGSSLTGYNAYSPNHAFSWTKAGGILDLGTLGGRSSNATGVNDAGQVVGWSEIPTTTCNPWVSVCKHAFLWTQAGGMRDLGTLGGTYSEAFAINAYGDVAGESSISSGNVHAFLWTPAAGMLDLGTISGPQSHGTVINDLDQVAGTSTVDPWGEYAPHPFLWRGGTMTDLGFVGSGFGASAEAINDAGQVAGQTAGQAFLWSGGTRIQLGTLAGTWSDAHALNATGEVVGESDSRAFEWTQATGMVALPGLSSRESDAVAVNGSGAIAGWSTNASGSYHAVLWAGDTTPPTIAVPASIVAEATGPGGAVVTYSASATDTVDGPVPVSCAPASGSIFPLGTTTVTCAARDSAGNVGTATFTVTVRDTTPPVVTVPADLVVNATSSAGAVVTYTATAYDLVDGPVAPACVPASGSTFPIGDTTVSCTATDSHGNTSAAATFRVHVRTPAEMLAALVADSRGVGPGASLAAKALAAQASYAAGDTQATCGQLAAYLNEVRAQTGKTLTSAQASALTVEATAIEAVLGC